MKEVSNGTERKLTYFDRVRWAPMVSRVALRIAAVVLAVSVLAAIQLYFFAANVSVVRAAALSTDFQQCADKNPTAGLCDWINSILQHNNSQYTEGRGVPQRVIFDGIPQTAGNMHTLTFQVLWSKGGIHAYDWLMSYDQAKLTAAHYNRPYSNFDANICGPNISLGAVCTALIAGGIFNDVNVPDDPFVSKDGATQPKIDAFETSYGNRTIRMYGNAAITAATLSISHDVPNNGDTGDSYVLYNLAWTSTSTQVLIEMAGHLAVTAFQAVDPVAWGVPLGSANINGGPYHFKLNGFDSGSLGNQDNQIQGADIFGPPFLSSQRTPAGAINVGQAVYDTAILTGTGGQGTLDGTVTFYICSDNSAPYTDTIQTLGGCLQSTPINPPQFNRTRLTPDIPVTLLGNNQNPLGRAISPIFTPTLNGFYCFTAEYNSTNPNYLSFSEVVTTSNECFFVQSPTAVTLTDFSARAGESWLPLALSAAGVVILATLAYAFAKKQS